MNSSERFGVSDQEEVSFHVLSEIQLIRRINRFEERVKSQNFLHRSDFCQLSEETAFINDGRLIAFDDEDIEIIQRPEWLYSDESAYLSVIWDDKKVNDQIYTAKAFVVEALPNGIIIVRGNIIGSTILSPLEWEDKKMNQMNALTKASRNPLQVQYEETDMINYSIEQKFLF